jgi:hypothetical protein
MQINKDNIPLTYGDIVVVPPGIRHRASVLTPEKPYRRFVFWVSRQYYAGLLDQSDAYHWLIDHTGKTGTYVYHLPETDCHTLHAKLIPQALTHDVEDYFEVTASAVTSELTESGKTGDSTTVTVTVELLKTLSQTNRVCDFSLIINTEAVEVPHE